MRSSLGFRKAVEEEASAPDNDKAVLHHMRRLRAPNTAVKAKEAEAHALWLLSFNDEQRCRIVDEDGRARLF